MAFFAVILAGGSGTRLWPVSRRRTPKQVQPFLDRDTMLQKTVARVRRSFTDAHIVVATGADTAAAVRKQLPVSLRRSLIVEPYRRDTAAAIGLAAATLYRRDPQAAFITISSDHYIPTEQAYHRAIRAAQRTIVRWPDHTVLVGVRPTYPETGYGYIQLGRQVLGGVFAVRRFVEKPDLKTAQRYVNSRRYLWNPALFCWRADHLLSLLQQHLPRHGAACKQIAEAPAARVAAVTRAVFRRLPSISIDYGVMEKIHRHMLVVPTTARFTDIGHWESLRSVLADQRGNVIKGKTVIHDSAGNLIYNFTDRLVAVAGLCDTIVVQTNDATFICPRHRAQDAKQIVKLLAQQRLWRYL